MIKCKLCDYQHEYLLSAEHLGTKHGISIKEYRFKFPDARIRSQPIAVREKSSANKKGKPSKLMGQKKTSEHIEKISASLKAKYSSGDITHWNKGNITPDEVRKKISVGNQNTNNIGNQKQREKKHERIKCGANQFNCEIIEIDDLNYKATAKCNECTHVFSFSHQVFYPERLVTIGKLCPICNPRETFSSKGEQELYDFIAALEPITIKNDREQLGGYELDVYIPSKKLAFEYTGLYWHSEKQNENINHLLQKKQFAAKNGIRLITIFEDEWKHKQEIVKSRIRAMLGLSQYRFSARKLILSHVESKVANEFLNANHIQGKDISSIRLGLFLGDELIQLATFRKTNVVKGGNGTEWELSRLCGKLNTTIIGGASRLIHAFKRKNVNTQLISYADRRWSDGEVYKKIGFDFAGTSTPSYWYLDKKYISRVHRSNFMKHRLSKYFGEVAEKFIAAGKTEWEIMQEMGYDRIWDCGTTKWIYCDK